MVCFYLFLVSLLSLMVKHCVLFILVYSVSLYFECPKFDVYKYTIPISSCCLTSGNKIAVDKLSIP